MSNVNVSVNLPILAGENQMRSRAWPKISTNLMGPGTLERWTERGDECAKNIHGGLDVNEINVREIGSSRCHHFPKPWAYVYCAETHNVSI